MKVGNKQKTWTSLEQEHEESRLLPCLQIGIPADLAPHLDGICMHHILRARFLVLLAVSNEEAALLGESKSPCRP